MKKTPLPKNCKKLAAVSCLFEGGRVAIEPIAALYLFSFGLSVGDYAAVKATSIAVFFLLDIPLAFVLNQLGERKSVFLAIGFASIGAVGYMLSNTLPFFCLSEGFLALSISIFNPSSASLSIRVCENSGVKGMDGRYFHLLGSLISVVVFAAGVLGGCLFTLNRHFPFVLYFFINFLAAAIFSKLSVEEEIGDRRIIPKISRKALMKLAPFAPIAMVLYAITDPLALYWQPMLVQNFDAQSSMTTAFYATYCGVYSIAAFVISKMIARQQIESSQILMTLPFLGAIFYCLFPSTNDPSFIFFAFAVCWACAEITITTISLEIRRLMPTDQRLFLGKIMSLFFRMGSVLAIGSSKFLIGSGWAVDQLLSFYGVFSLVLATPFSMYFLYKTLKKRQSHLSATFSKA